MKYFSFKQKRWPNRHFLYRYLFSILLFSNELLVFSINENSYFPISHPRLYAVLGITLHQIPIVILLFIILKRSKQTLSSIGFRKKGLKSSLLIRLFFCLYTYINTKNKWISIRNVLFPLLLYN